jgi:hypothetical protein
MRIIEGRKIDAKEVRRIHADFARFDALLREDSSPEPEPVFVRRTRGEALLRGFDKQIKR